MLTIQKTISLEPMTSRVPSVWPAYKDNKLYFFDDESLKKRNYEYPTNYGMIPLNVSFESDDPLGKHAYKITCNESGATMSFEFITQCYSFCKDYRDLLEHGGRCNKQYTSATAYYDSEIDNKYGEDLIYGNERSTYEELDEKYNAIDGVNFYTHINQEFIPTFRFRERNGYDYSIMEYSRYWGKNLLYYPDVIKWIAWFKERKHYESDGEYTSPTSADIEHWDCKSSGVSDCCDCEEYFKRGGKRVLDKMLYWYNTIQTNISGYTDIVLDDEDNVISCFTPSIIDHLELKNSLDNIGEFSILSPQYEVGIDYRGTTYSGSSNTRSGTTVINDEGTTLILKEGQGFCFSSDYMEKIFDSDDWDDYTYQYISGNPSEFKADGYMFYAFDDENRMYVGKRNTGAVVTEMSQADVYKVEKTDAILIDNAMIEITKGEFGTYDSANTYSTLSGRKFFVEREKETSTPYTVINGKKIYADSYLSGNGIVYYFTFFKNPNYTPTNTSCHDNGETFDINKYQIFSRIESSANTKDYISYDNKTFIFENKRVSGITIDGIEYPRISGYTHDKYGNIMYTRINEGKVYDSDFIEMPSATSLHGDEIWVSKWNSDVTIYSANTIVGKTRSRLTDLEAKNKLVDDTGNDINGLFNDSCKAINNIANGSNATYAQPPIYTILEPLYQVGNTSLIAKFKLTKDKQSEVTGTGAVNYFVGNIITEMKFYYKDVNGKIGAVGIASPSVSSLSAITIANINKQQAEGQNGTVFQDDLYCDVTYHIGATLQRKKNEPFKLATGKYNHGVEYTETVKFVKTPIFYRLKTEPNDEDIVHTKEYDTESLPHKYVIYTYELVQDMEDVESDVYETSYKAPIANFKAETNLVTVGTNKIPKTNYSKFNDMDDYDGINVSPTFMEEYKLGMATMEKVDSDIYIDRGINAAFERHLKLGEITTLDELVQYGNGYFKIMDN